MAHSAWSFGLDFVRTRGYQTRRSFRRRLSYTLVAVLVLSLLPWTPPAFTPAVERVLAGAPEAAQWVAPLALSVSGWVDEGLSTLGVAPVYAGQNITLTVTKRDDGPNLYPLVPVGPDPLTPDDDQLIYYVHITNTGSLTATVHLTDTLPEGLSCVDAWRIPGYTGGADWWPSVCEGRQVYLYTLDRVNSAAFNGLGPGQSAVLYVLAKVLWPVEDGHVFTNGSTSYYAVAEQEPGITYLGTDDVTTLVQAPRLAIHKSAEPDPVTAGGEVTYTLTISNSGHYALMAPFSLQVVDLLPAGTQYARHTTFSPATTAVATANGITWTIPFAPAGDAEFAPGEMLTAQLVVTVEDPYSYGNQIVNDLYSVSISNSDLVTPSVVTGSPVPVTVITPDVAVSKDALQGSVRVGEWITYTITYSNVGQAQASGVWITDTLPVSVTLTSSDPAADAQDGNSYGWMVGDLAAGSGGTITLTARVTTTGGWIDPAGTTMVTNIVSAYAPGDPNSGNNNDAATTPVLPGAASTIALAISPPIVPVPGPAQVQVTAQDAYSNPVYNGDGYTVTLESMPGAFLASSELTLVDGEATTSVTSTIPGTYWITATIGRDALVSDSAPVTFTSGVVGSFVIEPIGDQTAGIGFPITVTAKDHYGNTAVGFSGTANLRDAANPNTLKPAVSGSFVNGVLAGQMVTITLARPDKAIVVSSGSASSQSNPFTVTAAAPQLVTISMDPNPQVVGMGAELRAQVTDAYGNARAGDVVDFGTVPGALGSGTIDPSTGTSDSSGVATTTITSTLSGSKLVTGTVVGTIPAVSGVGSVSFVAGPPRYITLTVSPSVVESLVPATLVVTMTDSYGNACAGQPVTFTVVPPYILDTNTWISPNPATADGNGVATADIESVQIGIVTIEAQGTSVYSDTAQLEISVGQLARFLFSPVPDPLPAGMDHTLYITATDMFFNPRTTDTGAITLSDATGTLMPTTAWMTDGVASLTISITQAMVGDWIMGEWAADPNVFGSTNAFTVTAGAPFAVDLDYTPVISACRSQVLTATVRDRYDNPLAGATVTWTHSGVGTLTPTGPATTNDSGLVTATLFSSAIGAAHVEAEVAGLAPAAADVTFDASAPTVLTLTALPDTIRAGESALIVAEVRDCGGNLIANTPISGTILSGPGVLSPAGGTTDASGLVTFTLTSTQTGVVTVFAGDAATAQVNDTTQVTVQPGCPDTVDVSAVPQSIAPDGDVSTIVARVEDAYGNPVPGLAVDLSASGVAATLGSQNETTDAGGMVTTTLTSGSESGDALVTATVAAGGCPGKSGSVTVQVQAQEFSAYLPLVLAGYGGIDLNVASLEVIPEGGDQYEIRVTIENRGTTVATTDFWVDLYIDPTGPIDVNVIWNDVCQYGKAWYVRQDLGPGQALVLSTKDPDDPANPGDRYSNWPGQFSGPGVHQLWAMVDSYGAPGIGATIEYNEANNRYGPVSHSVPAGAAQITGSSVEIQARPGR